MVEAGRGPPAGRCGVRPEPGPARPRARTQWRRGGEADWAEFGPAAVSGASPAFGAPFREIFEAAGRDFYAIDPALFAPARLEFVDVATGKRRVFGGLEPATVSASFAAGSR